MKKCRQVCQNFILRLHKIVFQKFFLPLSDLERKDFDFLPKKISTMLSKLHSTCPNERFEELFPEINHSFPRYQNLRKEDIQFCSEIFRLVFQNCILCLQKNVLMIFFFEKKCGTSQHFQTISAEKFPNFGGKILQSCHTCNLSVQGNILRQKKISKRLNLFVISYFERKHFELLAKDFQQVC